MAAWDPAAIPEDGPFDRARLLSVLSDRLDDLQPEVFFSV